MLPLRAAIKQLGAPAEVGQNQTKWMKGRASNTKRDEKLTRKSNYKEWIFSQGRHKKIDLLVEHEIHIK